MKLYVWSGKGVLENYGYGMVVVYADSLEQARELVKPVILEYYWYLDPNDEDDKEDLKNRLAFLSCQPNTYDKPTAVIHAGSE